MMRPFLKPVVGLDCMLKLLAVFFAHFFTLAALAGQVDHARLTMSVSLALPGILIRRYPEPGV